MGFVATEQVEELSYDFNPHKDLKGVIPEPTTDQVEEYREAFFNSVKEFLGDEPDAVTAEVIDDLLTKSREVEKEATLATAMLTGIDVGTLLDLPFRVRTAFLGWIMGVFLSPEA